jgi:DNA topoisomerase-3
MPYRVYVTEKPSVAKALAEFLGVSSREEGCYHVKGGDTVTHLIGHLLVQAEPNHYLTRDQQARSRSFETLPIIPKKWVTFPKPETTERGQVKMRDGKPVPIPQLAIVCRLLAKADIIVNAGDIDREGQLVADEVIEYAGFDPAGSPGKPVERILLTSLDDTSIQRALAKPRTNGEPEFVQRRMAALARSRADWLIGMNGSRGYSIRAARTISVGRVQTPTLALVVRRDLEIENFKERDYFVPTVRLPDGLELAWSGRIEGADETGLDEEGRIIDRRVAEAIVQAIRKGLAGAVVSVKSEEKKEAPPLPFSLSKLQVAMSARHGMSAAETSKVAQSLYERHKMISYIGTDCQYLPEAQHADAPNILKQLSDRFGQFLNGANPDKRYACWNDKKISAHHAIVPTGVLSSSLSAEERQVYEAIAKRYISQFHPEYKYFSNSLDMSFGQDTFSVTQSEPLVLGWRAVEGVKKPSTSNASANDADHEAMDPDEEETPKRARQRKADERKQGN